MLRRNVKTVIEGERAVPGLKLIDHTVNFSRMPRPTKSGGSTRTPKSTQKPAPPRRAPGRPSGDGGDRQGRLLDVAVTLYARNGIANTPARAIASEAGVTPALIAYYFGNKNALTQAVIEQRILPAVAVLREHMQANGDDLSGMIAGFLHGAHAAVARHPWLPALWVREVLTEGGALRDLLLDRIAPTVPRLLAERFRQAHAKGRLNADLDPRLLVVSLVGLTLFPLAAEPIWRRLFPSADIDHDTLLHHTVALLDRGLEVERAPASIS